MSVIFMSKKRKISRPEKKPHSGDPELMEKVVAACHAAPSTTEGANLQQIKRTYGRKKYHDMQPVSRLPPEDGSPCTSVVHASSLNGSVKQPVACGPAATCRTKDNVGSGLEMRERVPVIVPVAQYAQRTSSAHSTKSRRSEFFCVKKETPSYPPGSQEETWQLQILAKGRVTCPKCKRVCRKTVEGLKKHMVACKLHVFKCTHCGKQLKTSTGMKYHLMADHNKLPTPDDGRGLDDHATKEKLRKVLKRLGKLKCSKEGCTGSFTSIMGYVYHMRKCGKAESELEKLLMNCKHCGKPYRSRAGLEYHLRSEHGPKPQQSDANGQQEESAEHEYSGRAKRTSAQVAIFHLREIANQELFKEWPKRKVQQDLVPDDRKLRYSRPGLPAFSQEVLRKWKNEVKLNRRMLCPNKGCGCYYTSVSGLKAHLGLCTLGNFHTGKYTCLICKKQFNSESGVKYHINSVHSQDWFVVKSKAKSFTSSKKSKPKKLCTPNPALVFPQEAWQDTETPTEATTSESVCAEQPEMKTKNEEKCRKYNLRAKREKACSESQSSSSGSETSSSESEAELQEGSDS
ncbi:zinc finger protein 512 [Tachysurus fulvidraco]|uniref:zinc finger protein 512 n=1 Tax=Tachysurus fulvidraco TaxID=1234273 RepID=UPI001FEE392A|nr:zinc finger protein 512 [Tachysurus fulvidraco]XP_026993851.2 zinc finger protein 512 [Tachysurus fulvidraco]